MNRLAVCSVLVAAIGLTSDALALEPLVWGHTFPSEFPYHTCAVQAAEQIEERTQIPVDVYPASTLGRWQELAEGLAIGNIDIMYAPPWLLGFDHEPFTYLESPYLFRDYDHWRAYTKSTLFDELTTAYTDRTGNHVAAIGYGGETHVTSNREIHEPADLEGLRLRVVGNPPYLFARAVGASPSRIPYAETYPALMRGVIDGQETTLIGTLRAKFYEVQEFLALTGHVIRSNLTILGNSAWDKLGDIERVSVIETLQEASYACSDSMKKYENTIREQLASEGMNVIPVDRSSFRDAVLQLVEDQGGEIADYYNSVSAL